MKKGDIVTIYNDPITETESEGKAKLIEHLIDTDSPCLEYWRVKFLSNNFTALRYIKVR